MDNSDGDFNVFGNQDISEICRSPNYVIINIVRQGGDASLHTARFHEIYNRQPEVDLSFKLWLYK
jgi:hypothetical protein